MFSPTDLRVHWHAFLAGEAGEDTVRPLPAGACPVPLDWLFDVETEYATRHDNSCGEVTSVRLTHLRGWRADPDPRLALGGQVDLLHVETIAPGLLAAWPDAVRGPRAFQAYARQVDAAALDRLGACVPWEDLSIWSGFQWGEAAAAAVEAVARGWPRLRGLELQYVPWTEGALRSLAAASFLPSLEDLHLRGSPLDERAAIALAEAAGPLVHLDLSEAGLGSAAAGAWAPKLRGARRIDLSRNPIGDDGLRALAESGALESVEDLRLARCDLGDAGIDALCAADPRRLTGLWLDDNRVTTAGLATLARSPLLGRLVHLSIASRSLPEPGLLAGRASEEVRVAYWFSGRPPVPDPRPAAPVPCATCDALADFSEQRSDSERSTRPAGFDRLVRLGISSDWSQACLCPGCGATFEWYHDRDFDTGITLESIRRLEGARAVKLLIDALAWPWPIDKPPQLLLALRARLGEPSLEALLARTSFDPEHLVGVELLGPEAAMLADRLDPVADTEVGARALAAIGAFATLEAAARAGHRPAIRALARSGPASCEATLAATLTRPTDPLARAEAAAGLGRLGVQRELLESTLATCLDSTVANACRAALAAMDATDTPRAAGGALSS